MRALLIHQAFVAPHHAGGTRHYEMATRLVRQGHEFTIVASDLSYLTGERDKDLKSGWVTEQELDGLKVLRAYTYPSLHRSFFWRIVSFLTFMVTSIWASLRAGEVDVVIGTTPPIFQAVSAWLISVLRWRPFILEVRDLWPEFAIDLGVLRNRGLIWLSRKLERFLYDRAAYILVNSPAYRDYLLNKGIDAEKIRFIPNGVDPEMFKNASGQDVRAEFGLDEKFLAIYAGALGMANDIDSILTAAQLLRDDERIHFLLVGDGKDRHRLEAMASGMDLSNVTFAGAVPKTKMPSVLAAADVCLATLRDIPLFKTTYPNKVFDYMAASRPVILAIDGVIRDVIEASGGGVYVEPGQPDQLAHAIKRMLESREETRSMGIAGQRYVVQHFDRSRHAEELRDLFVEATGKAA